MLCTGSTGEGTGSLLGPQMKMGPRRLHGKMCKAIHLKKLKCRNKFFGMKWSGPSLPISTPQKTLQKLLISRNAGQSTSYLRKHS